MSSFAFLPTKLKIFTLAYFWKTYQLLLSQVQRDFISGMILTQPLSLMV